MDVGYAAAELDAFSRFLPLPFRVSGFLILGVWAWALNLHHLSLAHIDTLALICYPRSGDRPSSPSSSSLPPSDPLAQATVHHSVYRLASILTVPYAVCLVLFWLITRGDDAAVVAWDVVPNLFLLGLVVFFALPLRSAPGRRHFLSVLGRVSLGGLARAHDGRFGDVLAADVLTSYSKVLGDLVVTLCAMLRAGQSTTQLPDRGCGGKWLVPVVFALPSVIRLRQCLTDYARVRRARVHDPSLGWGGQHLANALKYSTALPVIVLSALQRGYEPDDVGRSSAGVFRLWLFFVFVNSFYSFYWDVAKDWHLSLFSSEKPKGEPWGLRRQRFFHPSQLYYGVIAADLMLRCTWSFKLSPHLTHFNDLEGGVFLLELLEVFRRWIWIFFRVETEWGRLCCSLSTS